jgi:hypothetical protein
MLDIDVTDRGEQRKFGLVMAAAFGVLTLIRWGIHRWLAGEWGPPSFILLGIGAVFAVLALAAPRTLEPIFWAWIRFALGVNWVMTRVLLTLVFFLMIVPTRVLVRLFSDDPLKRKWLPESDTYWEEPEEQPEEPERYLDQY